MAPNIDADLIEKVYVFCRELTIIDNMIKLPCCFKQSDQMTEALTPQPYVSKKLTCWKPPSKPWMC